MKCLLFLVLVLFVSSISFSQPKAIKEVQAIVGEIANSNKYESLYVGFAASASEQYKRMLQLKKVATKEELLALTLHEKAAVRLYSYIALRQKYPKQSAKVYERLIKDNTDISTLEGCIGGVTTIAKIVHRFPPE